MFLVPLAPFLVAIVAPWAVRFVGGHSGWLLGLVPAAMFIQLLALVPTIADGNTFSVAQVWVASATPAPINFSLYFDGLSLTFGLLISGIGTFIVIYSGGYLAGHRHQGRFMAFMLMFMGSMMGLVLADSIITLFVFWELTAVTSFLLIGFDHRRQAARRGAIQALVITGGGGLAMLAGLIILAYTAGTWDISQMLSQPGKVQAAAVYPIIFLLVLAGAFTKSAQVPFHFWLPNAMEAPTPVSAYLHSATMVKAGVYLLARMHPVLGGTTLWSLVLPVFGGATLLTGAIMALRHTDMKQMLAYTTMGTLGMLVMLLGVGSKLAITAAMVFLIAHSFYKGALFMVAGTIDHATGTREITQLSGLRGKMPITFAAAALAAFSMAGLPFALGYFAKEEIYLLLDPAYSGAGAGPWMNTAIVMVAFLGNALMLAAGAAIAIKPFFGPLAKTPLAPHEGALALVGGSLILGVLGFGVGFYIAEFGDIFLSPAVTAVAGVSAAVKLETFKLVWLPALLSLATWILGAVFFIYLDRIRTFLRRVAKVWSWGPDQGFDQAMGGLIRFSALFTRVFHHGKLDLYITLIFSAFAAAILLPMAALNLWPAMPHWPQLSFYEWGIMAIAVVGLAAVILGSSRLVAIVSLGIQGFAVAIIFMLFGAPDLAFTQFMVETLSVVILALVMTRLHLDQHDNRMFERVVRDGAVALACGFAVTAFLFVVLQTELDSRLSEFFALNSSPLAHGKNIVNVILVDFRALDTLGEIAVVMTAGIAILALIRMRAGGRKTGVGAIKKTAQSTRKPGPVKRGTRLKSAERTG
ncbi:MAG: putative monovalent cation/H+ antiporter subunit A [Alphaproteobacteria bacterium]|nr:putative monovalent cation/H+ antiporter subunit A [Alphaproteobacteria bacterium]